jgi:hypothetical protein
MKFHTSGAAGLKAPSLIEKETAERRTSNIDGLVKSPKFRPACEGRHPEVFENTG